MPSLAPAWGVRVSSARLTLAKDAAARDMLRCQKICVCILRRGLECSRIELAASRLSTVPQQLSLQHNVLYIRHSLDLCRVYRRKIAKLISGGAVVGLAGRASCANLSLLVVVTCLCRFLQTQVVASLGRELWLEQTLMLVCAQARLLGIDHIQVQLINFVER